MRQKYLIYTYLLCYLIYTYLLCYFQFISNWSNKIGNLIIPENPGVNAAIFRDKSGLSKSVFNLAKCTLNIEALEKILTKC